MELRKVNVEDLIPYENNPRNNDGAVEAVAESIKQCGYVAPIIVDENMVILAGHTRLKALKSVGGGQIEVIVRSGLTEEQKRKYRVLDNKVGEIAQWDFDKLEEELDGLDFEGFDFGFENKGSDFSYIDDLYEKSLQNHDTDNDKFAVTFTFDKVNEDIINAYIKKVTKEAIAEQITKEAIASA